MPYFTPSTEFSFSRIEVHGKDTFDFFQRISTADLNRLDQNHGTSSFILNPNGKFESSFTLWKASPEKLFLEVERGSNDHWKNQLTETIDKYRFSEDVSIFDSPVSQSIWLFDQEALDLDLKQWEFRETESETWAHRHGDEFFERPWVTVWSSSQKLQEWKENVSDNPLKKFDDLECSRILALSPRVEHEITTETNPLELGLVSKISKDKGCYPGQEVIEKIISLGAPAKRLVKIKGEGAPPTLKTSLYGEKERTTQIGTTTSITKFKNSFIALGLVKKNKANKDQEVHFENESSGHIAEVSPYL